MTICIDQLVYFAVVSEAMMGWSAFRHFELPCNDVNVVSANVVRVV